MIYCNQFFFIQLSSISPPVTTVGRTSRTIERGGSLKKTTTISSANEMSPGNVSFDVFTTPDISTEMFVSPLSTQRKSSKPFIESEDDVHVASKILVDISFYRVRNYWRFNSR